MSEKNETEFDDGKNISENSTNDNDDLQESIVCSPELTQYIDDNDKEDFKGKISEFNSTEAKTKNYNLTLFELISQKQSKHFCDTDNESNLSISNISKSTYNNMMDIEEKSIGGLFLRNPRGFFNYF